MAKELELFNAPIPGESLTGTPGGTPMEKPPKFADPQEAAEFMFDHIVSPKVGPRIIALLKRGVPTQLLTRFSLHKAFSQGLIDVDTLHLIGDVVHMQIVAVGIRAGVKNLKINMDEFSLKEFGKGAGEEIEEVSEEIAGVEEEINEGLLGDL